VADRGNNGNRIIIITTITITITMVVTVEQLIGPDPQLTWQQLKKPQLETQQL
jgi:hypothetical protein